MCRLIDTGIEGAGDTRQHRGQLQQACLDVCYRRPHTRTLHSKQGVCFALVFHKHDP